MYVGITAALVAAATITCGAGIAHADPLDQQFLGQLGGVPLAPEDSISYAHRTCDAQAMPSFSIGIPPPRTFAFLQMQKELSAKGLMEPQMMQLKRAAITGN
jgi:hypothetical protein